MGSVIMISSSEKYSVGDSTVTQRAVIQRWQAIAQAGLILRIYVRDHYARPAWKAVKYHPPRIDNHTVAMGFPAIDMITALGRRHDICEIFDGTGAYQCFPVRLARSRCEGCRSKNNVYFPHGTIKLRKAYVIANGKADAAEWGLQGNDSAACLNRFFLGIILVAQLQAEYMYFVVTCNLLAFVV